MSNKSLKWLIWMGVGLILILGTCLIWLINDRFLTGPNGADGGETGVVIDTGLAEGEAANRETLGKLNDLMEKEPAFRHMPKKVEYFSDDYSEYTKYAISYALDDSERGFYLIYKDYTGVGQEKISAYVAEMGMSLDGVRIEYINLTNDMLNAHAED